MEKYPRMTLGQLEQKMPQLEREYGQEKTMRKAERWCWVGTTEYDIFIPEAAQDSDLAHKAVE